MSITRQQIQTKILELREIEITNEELKTQLGNWLDTFDLSNPVTDHTTNKTRILDDINSYEEAIV